MKLELASVGNPDFGQDPNKPLYGAVLLNTTLNVDSFEMASLLCRQFIELNDLGAGNWAGGDIKNDEGARIAYVSYNGAVWKLGANGERTGGKRISLNLENENSLKTKFSLKGKKNPYGDNCTQFHYQDEEGRDFIFRDTNSPFEYLLVKGTHNNFKDVYFMQLLINEFTIRSIRRKYYGGYEKAISELEVYI